MSSVFLIFLIICGNGIQGEHIDDLTGTVPADNLMLVKGAAVRSNIPWKSIVDTLNLVFDEISFEMGFNGEKHDLILTPEGDKVKLFELIYFIFTKEASV